MGRDGELGKLVYKAVCENGILRLKCCYRNFEVSILLILYSVIMMWADHCIFQIEWGMGINGKGDACWEIKIVTKKKQETESKNETYDG